MKYMQYCYLKDLLKIMIELITLHTFKCVEHYILTGHAINCIHTNIDTQPVDGSHSYSRLGHSEWMSTYCTGRCTLDMLNSHYSLSAAMQAYYIVERMHDLRPVFEVHRGREWELMDLCFMICFTGALPL